MGCLEDSAIARLAGDELDSTERGPLWNHLEHCQDCAARFSSALGAANDDVATAAVGPRVVANLASASAVELTRGMSVGRYMIVEMIGSGGLGAVYSAFDPELDRKVAIKVLKTQTAFELDPNLMRVRLLREARAMARLSHPNVAPVFDVGTYAGEVFLAMELIDGETFRQWRRSDTRSWQSARDVLCEAGRGLIAAHDAGLIHRDFKPGNIMIGRDGRVRVLDFGLARGSGDDESLESVGRQLALPDAGDSQVGDVLDDQHPLTAPLTETGQAMGTPGYMAPEQYDDTALVDARADQFAFCVTLYEAVFAQRPFVGKDPRAIREATVAGQITRPAREREVPAWLESAILKGLSTEPADRFGSMRELLDAISVDKRRRPWAKLAVGLCVTAALSVAGTLAWTGEVAPSERDEVEQFTIDARAAAARSLFIYPLADEPDVRTAYSVIIALEATEGSAEELADERGDELRHEFAETLTRLGDEYAVREGGLAFASDYYAQATVFVEGDTYARQHTLMSPGELATLRHKARTGDFSAQELRAAEPLRALAAPDEATRRERVDALLESRARRGHTTRMHLQQVMGIADDEPVSPNPAATATVAENVTTKTATEEEEQPRAATKPKDSRAPKPDHAQGAAPADPTTKTEPKRDPARARELARQAAGAFGRNQLGEAEKLFHRALELDGRNQVAIVGLADLYFERGRYRKALEFARRAVELGPNKARHHLILGDAHFKVLEYAKARQAYEKAANLGSKGAAKRLERLERTVGR